MVKTTQVSAVQRAFSVGLLIGRNQQAMRDDTLIKEDTHPDTLLDSENGAHLISQHGSGSQTKITTIQNTEARNYYIGTHGNFLTLTTSHKKQAKMLKELGIVPDAHTTAEETLSFYLLVKSLVPRVRTGDQLVTDDSKANDVLAKSGSIELITICGKADQLTFLLTRDGKLIGGWCLEGPEEILKLSDLPLNMFEIVCDQLAGEKEIDHYEFWKQAQAEQFSAA